MNPNTRHPHLSDDDLDDILIGAGSPEAEDHLAGCATCAERKVAFTAAVAGFNHATLAWSEAKSHTLTRDLIAGRPATSSQFGLTAAGLCGLALIAAVLSTGLTAHLRSNDDAATTAPQTTPIDRDREIAGDNAMLQDIAAALYRPDPSPEQTYQLDRAATASAHRTVRTEVRE